MTVTVAPDWWKTLFDEVYLITDARTVCDEETTRREIDLFCRLVPIQPADNILDLCGGQGRHAIELCRRGFSNCCVLDYSHTLLKIGAENAGLPGFPVSFVRADARKTGLLSESCDHVLILGNSLGYISDAEADTLILKESHRLLKPNGWLLLDVTDGRAVVKNLRPNAWHEIEDEIIVCRQREIRNDCLCAREIVLSRGKGLIRDKTYCIRLYAPEQLARLVEAAGFSDVRLYFADEVFESDDDLGCMNYRVFVTGRKFFPARGSQGGGDGCDPSGNTSEQL